jgi:hypothetical protein
MRIIAPMMILIMMTSTLAGCTGGDPDSGGNDNIDMDVINSLIDDNLQDFINNTTITVENHYHNNTTIINNDNSQNNFTGTSSGSYNANMSLGGEIQVIDLFFSLDTLMDFESIDYRNNVFDYNYTYYDYLTNTYRDDMFSMSCSNYYLVGSGNNSSSDIIPHWVDSSGYYAAWDSLYNNTIRDLLNSIANDEWLREICDESFYTGQNYYDNLLLHEIHLEEGSALQCMQNYDGNSMQEEWFWNEEDSQWDEYDNQVQWQAISEMIYPDGDYALRGSYIFNTNMMYLSTNWECYEGLVGGSEDSVLSINVSHIIPNYEYRFQLYYRVVPVTPSN